MTSNMKSFSIDFILNNKEEKTSPILIRPRPCIDSSIRSLSMPCPIKPPNLLTPPLTNPSSFGLKVGFLNSSYPTNSPTAFSPSSHSSHSYSPTAYPSYPYHYQVPIQAEQYFKCPYEHCNKSFNKKANLKSHMQTHSGARPYACSHCSMAFTRKHDLKRHLISIHSILKPYKCIFCPASFSRMGSIKRHLLSDTTTTNHPSDAYQQYIRSSRINLLQ
jgi:uncharacterized Zn-finger protein